MKPYLLAELALHGEGRLAYYQDIVTEIARSWTGWPPIMIKTQSWFETDSPWYRRVLEQHGRPPLPSLCGLDHTQLKRWCNGLGFPYAVTMHDLKSFELAECDYVKLGSFDLTRPELRDAAMTCGKVIVSEGLTYLAVPGWAERRLQCVSKYPANIGYSGSAGGYSCHSVLGLAEQHVLAAAPHCHTIEVHVTARPVTARPQPSDMPVSLSVEQFVALSKEVGKLWRAE